MKEGWEYKKLGNVASIVHGKNQKDVLSKDGKYPIYGSGGSVIGYASQFLCDAGTTILGRKGTINNPLFINHKFWNVDTAFGIVAKENVDKKFIFYYVKSQDWSKRNSGATLPSLTQKIVSESIIHIPSLPEQQQIVTYLDNAFAKIDAIKANAEKSLEEAKALFQSALKELMEPKEGWEEMSLEELATDMYRGSGIKRDQVTPDGIPCVRYGEIYTTYNYAFKECKSHTFKEAVNSPKYFEHGDLLFAITGESVEEIGKTIAYIGNDKCMCGGDIVVMKHNQNAQYLSYALSTPNAIKQKGHGKTKLKVVHTNIPSLMAITIAVPPIKIQEEIVTTLDSLSSKITTLKDNLTRISSECDAMKQALLRQVFE